MMIRCWNYYLSRCLEVIHLKLVGLRAKRVQVILLGCLFKAVCFLWLGALLQSTRKIHNRSKFSNCIDFTNYSTNNVTTNISSTTQHCRICNMYHTYITKTILLQYQCRNSYPSVHKTQNYQCPNKFIAIFRYLLVNIHQVGCYSRNKFILHSQRHNGLVVILYIEGLLEVTESIFHKYAISTAMKL